MMPAMSPFRVIVDDPRETSLVLFAGAEVEALSSSRPNAKNAPDATSAPHRPPISAPTRSWRRRFGRSGLGGGGPGGVGHGGTVGGSSGHVGGGEGGTVNTSAGGTASSGTSLTPRQGVHQHRHLKRRRIRRRFLEPLSCCSHLHPRMIPPNSGNRTASGTV